MDKPTKTFGIYYWDTFELPGEDTFLVGEADTYKEATDLVLAKYNLGDGADKIEIVKFPEGNIVFRASVRGEK